MTKPYNQSRSSSNSRGPGAKSSFSGGSKSRNFGSSFSSSKRTSSGSKPFSKSYSDRDSGSSSSRDSGRDFKKDYSRDSRSDSNGGFKKNFSKPFSKPYSGSRDRGEGFQSSRNSERPNDRSSDRSSSYERSDRSARPRPASGSKRSYASNSDSRPVRSATYDDRPSGFKDKTERREDSRSTFRSNSRDRENSGDSRGFSGGRGGQSRDTTSRGPRNFKNQKQGRVQKTMAIDYNLLVKKAAPQAIADYVPTKTFSEHGLHENIIASLDVKGYTQPTAIQDQAIPHILESKDLIGIANTGTGKTAAFLLPLIHQIYANPDKKILILAPTRELVAQIASELHSFTKGTPIGSTTIIGGVHQDKQVAELRKRKNFIISTTGRGLDLIKQNKLSIREVDTVVLDEMDQMLDMGFIKDIQQILNLAVNKKHLLFFSATINKEVDKIAREILRDPILISVIRGQTADNVNQDVVEISSSDNKFDKLCEILGRPEVEKAIVFENTKHGSARIEKELIARGFKALAIHGNKNQNQRTRALDSFKSGRINILIATNVAARGLDIPLVSHVINYSLPQSKDDYIHRIGRTGRAGEIGQAYTFVPV